MLNAIPVFSPQDSSLFLRYFSGVADMLSRRFSLGFQPDEEHLTSLLCELLDDKGSTLHGLEYSASDLNQDLQEFGSLLQADISLETIPHTKYQESHLTQADLGLLLEYRDQVDPSNSFSKGLLVQAKKLFPSSGTEYSLSSRYESFNPSQHERLSKIDRHYTKSEHGSRKHLDQRQSSGVKYLLYNPPFNILPKHEQEYVIHRQLGRESKAIYDYTAGLCLYNALTERDGLKNILGLSALFADVDTVHSLAESAAFSGRSKKNLAPFDLGSVMDSLDIRERSFAWFLVFSFLSGQIGSQLPEFLNLVTGSEPSMSANLGFGVPRFVLTVAVAAGTEREK